jgi:release factor glutamine methyltransferase
MCAIAEAGQGVRGIARVLERGTERLRAAGVESPRLDAELLLAWAARVERSHLITRGGELTSEVVARFESAIARRERREPVAYIVGVREFHSMDFEVSPAVLIPRPETETIVEAAVRLIANRADARVLDIGTGSGAIAVSIAHECPRVKVTASDTSADALEVARRNADRHGVADRVEVRRADLFEPLDGGAPLGSYDLIVSNPPYVEAAALLTLAPEVRDFEPRGALVDGADGLECFRRIATAVGEHLLPDGALMVEVGTGQAEAVRDIFAGAGMRRLDVINDLSAIARVVTARY